MSVPRLLVDVGNNANQVAKVTNATGETPAQTEDGFRAYRFSLMEAGRVLQSMGLATSYLGLASYASPQFYDDRLESLCQLDGLHQMAFAVQIVGKPKD